MVDLSKYTGQQAKHIEYKPLCYTCGRQQKGFGRTVKDDFKSTDVRQYCSIKCQEIDMDWTSRETEAMKFAIRMVGEYMNSIGKGDIFSGLTAAEGWTMFADVYTKNYHAFLSNKKIIDDEIPY